MKQVAVLGTGAMGSRMALKLVEAGHSVVVYNRTAERCRSLVEAGAQQAETPALAAAKADVVIAMVRDNDSSREVWLGDHGAVAGLSDNAIAIDSSTLTPEWVIQLGQSIHQRCSASFLEAPVVGSRPQAEAGELVVLVGGNRDTYHRIADLFPAFAKKTEYAGSLWNASAAKLVINSLFAIQVSAFAESLGSLIRQGLEESDAIQLLQRLPITSPAANRALELFGQRNFAANFPVSLVSKDLDYAVDAATGADAQVPQTVSTAQIFRDAVMNGFGEDDILGVAQLFLPSRETDRSK